MVTFTSALLFIFLVDKLLTPVRNALASPAEEHGMNRRDVLTGRCPADAPLALPRR